MLVSIVSSFRNEEQTLPELLRRLRATVDGLGVKSEFIFVNDASNDRSQDILAREAAADSRVKVVSLSRRFGFGPGVIAGLEHAKGDAVLDWREMTARYPGVQLRLLEGSDHGLSDFAAHIDGVMRFLALD